jgi:long-chain acyl-CoA synthetase
VDVLKDGFLKSRIVRKKCSKLPEVIYAPQLIENTMKQSRFIVEIMVIGDGQKMPAAIIQLDFDFLKNGLLSIK